MIPLAVFPWPPPSIPIPAGVTPVRAVPGTPTTVLALGNRPPWITTDLALVTTPAGVPTAIDIILSGQPDPRIITVEQQLAEIIPGIREMTEVELRREDLDYGS